MAMHRLTSVTIGVPNLRETAEYYLDFGLIPTKDEVFSAYSGELLTDATEYRFRTRDGGEQLRLVQAGPRGPRHGNRCTSMDTTESSSSNEFARVVSLLNTLDEGDCSRILHLRSCICRKLCDSDGN